TFAASVLIAIVLASIALFNYNFAFSLIQPAGGLVFLTVGVFMVRFSLAPVATFAERRIVVLDSWRLTRGHFWSLLGAYALTFFCFLVVGLLIVAIFFAAGRALMLLVGVPPITLRDLLNPRNASLKNILTVGIIASTVLSSLLGTLWNVI